MPRSASARAIARPRRRPAPVTSATRPPRSTQPPRGAIGRISPGGRVRPGDRQRHHALRDILQLHVGRALARGRHVVARPGHPGRHRVHPYVTVLELERQALRESGDGGLGGGVHRHRTLRREVRDRREVHDAAARVRERLDRRLRDQHRGLQVDRHLAIHVPDGERLERPVGREPAGDVDDDVEPVEVAERHLHRERRDVGLGEVAGAGPGVHAERGELPHPLGHADRVQVAGDDPRARLAEGQRDRVADLSRPADAGDEDDLAGEVERRAHAHLANSRTISAPGAPA